MFYLPNITTISPISLAWHDLAEFWNQCESLTSKFAELYVNIGVDFHSNICVHIRYDYVNSETL